MISYDTVIFTEAGRNTGLGHLSRCIALYDELEKRQRFPVLIVNGDETIGVFTGTRKFLIDNWHKNWLKYLRIENAKGIYCIIDSYLADKNIYRCIQESCRKVLYIDDYSRIEYPKGIIVNPSIYGDLIPYKKNEEHIYLTGIDYVIIRSEFKSGYQREAKEELKDILIILGGSDILNLTSEITEVLLDRDYQGFKKHIVLGHGQEDFINRFKSLNNNFFFYSNLNAGQVFELMRQCDLAITAAGQTIYELIAMQLPFVCIKVIENQTNNINGLIHLDIIDDFLDCSANIDTTRVKQFVNSNLEKYISKAYRKNQIKKMKELNLSKGVSNIIDIFIDKNMKKCEWIEFTNLDEGTLLQILSWRNNDIIRQNMFNNNIISPEEHLSFIESLKNDKTKHYYYIVKESFPIGVVCIINIDPIEKAAEGGLYANPDYIGSGIGKDLMETLLTICIDVLYLKKLYLKVKKNNKRALKLYLNFGFKIEDENEEYYLTGKVL